MEDFEKATKQLESLIVSEENPSHKTQLEKQLFILKYKHLERSKEHPFFASTPKKVDELIEEANEKGIDLNSEVANLNQELQRSPEQNIGDFETPTITHTSSTSTNAAPKLQRNRSKQHTP